MSVRVLLLAGMALLAVACAGTKPSQTSSPPNSSKTDSPSPNAMNEDFDPLTLKQPEFQIPPRKTSLRDEPQGTAPAGADTGAADEDGYQVQLLQTEDAALARNAVRDAAAGLATTTEMIFDSPYYKVRAGNFVNRYDAEQLQELAASKGYASAWVVRTKAKAKVTEAGKH